MGRAILDNLEPMLARAGAAPRLLLALDFDGTLAPIVPSPEDAELPHATAVLLGRILHCRNITLAIVSGRSIADLKRRVGLDCIYVGNHGLEIEGPGVSFLHSGALARRPVLRCACTDLDAALADAAGAFVERKELSATVHFRQAADSLHESVTSAVHGAMRPYATCLDLLPARKAWEVRPRVAWHKGTALEFLVRRQAEARPLVISAGDDHTDEHMFRAEAEGVSIHVGNGIDTAADYTAAGPAELAAFLAHLVS